MLESDNAVAVMLFDCLREREQAYACFCLIYLLQKSGARELLFRALRREFEERMLVSAIVSGWTCSYR
jgi:hypothetical protein